MTNFYTSLVFSAPMRISQPKLALWWVVMRCKNFDDMLSETGRRTYE